MQKLRSYISILFLALVLFPVIEKASHELGHLHADHCDTKGLHYCAAENSCDVCDYILASSIEPSAGFYDFKVQEKYLDTETFLFTSKPISSVTLALSLRGPPPFNRYRA